MESTTVYELSTGTPLAASSDDNNDSNLLELKRKQKQIVLSLSTPDQPDVGNISSSPFCLHYRADRANDVLVVVITKLQFPESLAMSYLSELHDEFTHIHLKEMNASKQRGEMIKPYQYMSFETFITKTKRVYADSRAKDGLHDVHNQLNDVKNIMNKNINDLLNRGENLNNLQDLSSSLREQSVKYKKYAKKINWDLLIKQYAPVAVVALVFLLLIYRWFF
jgi:vesicle transport protein SEC22